MSRANAAVSSKQIDARSCSYFSSRLRDDDCAPQVAQRWKFLSSPAAYASAPGKKAELLPNASLSDLGRLLSAKNYQVCFRPLCFRKRCSAVEDLQIYIDVRCHLLPPAPAAPLIFAPLTAPVCVYNFVSLTM